MRAIWSGTIAFGLIALPVKLYSATEEHAVRLHEIHTADAGRVRYRRVCEDEDREIPYEEVGRGFELPDGRMVQLTEEDLARLPLPSRKTVQVLCFMPAADVDPLTYSRPYYAAPAVPAAERPYALLTAALARTDYVALSRVAIRARERLAVLRPREGVLIVHTLLWPDEVRDPGDLAPSVPVEERELQLAEVLMRELSSVEAQELHDEYRHALEQLVAAKVSGGELVAPPEPQPVVDLMAALEASLRAVEHRGER